VDQKLKYTHPVKIRESEWLQIADANYFVNTGIMTERLLE
jgi:hypothetical protein